MSYTSYIIKKYTTSHENAFFRKFDIALTEKFSTQQGEHILIGNISVNGHEMDAIFVTNGQICIIDFKDYKGQLVFNENNPWRIKTDDNKLVFVQGGGRFRNPFHQVKAYRFALMEFLSEAEMNITTGKRNNIKWDHITTSILFHGDVKFDNSKLPSLINKYFSIDNPKTIVNKIEDSYSDKLEFNDTEIQNILIELGVNSTNLVNDNTFDDFKKISIKKDGVQLSLIKKLLKKSTSTDRYKNILEYYKTVINVERYKEPSANNLHKFPFDKNQDVNSYKIDISTSKNLHDSFVRNKQERFPKNIFVALNLNIDGINHPFLHTIVLVSDLKNNSDIIEINLDEFELYIKGIEDAGLGEDEIEEINTAINNSKRLNDKIKVLEEYIGSTVLLTSSISVGFSTESLFTAQLLSEINTLTKYGRSIDANGIYDSFINNKAISNINSTLNIGTFIKVTELNSSQERAVLNSFKNPLSVITGPPGTGKTQVVLNIIANAITNGHSCLFASKNNKAVDNVIDRLNNILDEKDYLLRVGSKSQITSTAKPKLNRILTKKNNSGFKNKEEALITKKTILKDNNKEVKRIIDEIKSIPEKESKIDSLNKELEVKIQDETRWVSSLSTDSKQLFYDQNIDIQIDKIRIGELYNIVNSADNNFFTKLFFDWFKKDTIIKEIKIINSGFDEEIIKNIERESPWISTEYGLTQSISKNLKYIINLKKTSLSISEKKINFQQEIDLIKTSKQQIIDEVKVINKNKDANIKKVKQFQIDKITLGKEILNLSVNQRIFNLNSLEAQDYVDYIPSNVWRDEDVNGFYFSTKEFLKGFNSISITSLSVKNSIPLREKIVDLLVIDEASQCDIASALPLIYRAKNIVIIGDPLQLTHITSVSEHEEDYIQDKLKIKKLKVSYVKNSLYDYSFNISNKSTLESTFLDEHFRCHHEIIDFSNQYFYNRKLGNSMVIKTKNNNYSIEEAGINWVDTTGEMSKDKNINISEVNKCIDLASKLKVKYPDASIGIVTPFKHQYLTIFNKLPEDLKTGENPIKVDTVHKYQGDEKDIMIFSTVITDNSPAGKAWFVNRNDYLINVAITRAKSSLFIVGNHEYCKNLIDNKVKTPLCQLANYVESLNKVIRN